RELQQLLESKERSVSFSRSSFILSASSPLEKEEMPEHSLQRSGIKESKAEEGIASKKGGYKTRSLINVLHALISFLFLEEFALDILAVNFSKISLISSQEKDLCLQPL